MRLYVPETWTADPARRRAVGVPDTVAFAPKWQHALALLDAALRAGVRRHVVLGDAAFGEVTAFRDALTLGGLVYLLGVQGSLVVWPPGTPFTVPARRGTTGRPRSMPRPTLPTSPVTLAALAVTLRHRRVTWREGSPGPHKRHALPPCAYASRIDTRRALGPAPSCGCSVNGRGLRPRPPSTTCRGYPSRRRCVRWCGSRSCVGGSSATIRTQGELGLDHFEGRTWNGVHYHMALCAAPHAFLALRRALFPPALDAMDNRDGAPTSAVAAAASAAPLSAVWSAHQRRASTAPGITNVIK
jgi:hypothetical protein